MCLIVDACGQMYAVLPVLSFRLCHLQHHKAKCVKSLVARSCVSGRYFQNKSLHRKRIKVIMWLKRRTEVDSRKSFKKSFLVNKNMNTVILLHLFLNVASWATVAIYGNNTLYFYFESDTVIAVHYVLCGSVLRNSWHSSIQWLVISRKMTMWSQINTNRHYKLQQFVPRTCDGLGLGCILEFVFRALYPQDM